jgi:hypothetical protein
MEDTILIKKYLNEQFFGQNYYLLMSNKIDKIDQL